MLKSQGITVKRGFSSHTNEKKAINELLEQIYQPDASLNAVFVSPRYDLTTLGTLIENAFGKNVIGCTTAGEITPQGYRSGTICGFSISGAFNACPHIIRNLKNLSDKEIGELVLKIWDYLPQTNHTGSPSFAISLIDGLSMMEERLLLLLGKRLGHIPIVGGSAGDDQNFKNTCIYHRGRFQNDCAVYCLCTTTVPFRVIKTQHFISTERRLLITRADPDKRLVYEINGQPAAAEYANISGLQVSELNVNHFFNNPLLLRLNDKHYVHSIKKANDDGSLVFFSAVDEGLVLRGAAKSDIAENLKNSLIRASSGIGKVNLTIGFDCVHRKLEIEATGKADQIEKILEEYNTIGFCTYGEQYRTSHVNQTFTAVALGTA